MENKMRILFIAGGDCKYGASKSMMSLILYLKAHYEVEPVLLTKQRNELNIICDEKGIENHSCWYCDFMSGSPYSFFPLKVAKHAVKYALYIAGTMFQKKVLSCGIDFDTIDIIHTNHSRIQIGAYISSKKKIPHVWHIREFGLEDYNVIFYKPNTIGYMNQGADIFIAISNAVREKWIQKGIHREKIITIYNGIESRKFLPRKIRKDGVVKLVISGHIQPNKGQHQVVEAVALLPDELRSRVQLDIIGSGYKDYISRIKRMIVRYSLTNVSFLGYCDNVPERLAEYDVGVVCSRAEGFGRVTAEYLQAGLYVIASNTGANPELISNEEEGILYEYGNVNELSERIKEVCICQEKYCSKITGASRFNMDAYGSGVYSVYRKLLQ